MKEFKRVLVDEQETINMGAELAAIVKQQHKGLVAYLHGDLGAGKTTLTRGFVVAMGHVGKVKSPTYTLVEPYDLADWHIYHFDLYRLSDPEELEFMGIRDYFNDDCCSFIEWPEKGAGFIVNADIHLNLAYSGEQRELSIVAETPRGEDILRLLSA